MCSAAVIAAITSDEEISMLASRSIHPTANPCELIGTIKNGEL